MPSVLSYANAFPQDNVLARQFNGTFDFINVGNSATLNPTTTFSISAWAYPTSVNGWIFARDDNTLGRSFAFGLVSQAVTLFVTTATVTGSNATLNAWQHLAVVGNAGGTSWTIYINGVSAGTGSAGPPGSTTGNTTIGERTFSGFQTPFSGWLTDIGFWGVSLSALQIAALAAGARASSVGTPIGVWPITGASPEPDKSGNGNNGVLNGTALPWAALSLGGPATLGLI